ncbi:MAG: TIGR03617 family F420-dependent LLM class oxidoreductase [Armatimonadota bacterium]|nr:TIGR03617 family F420-dependent LLM class oxidoreductase [Armatimonadota bacterium]MDR7452212.1 TIGR03617 family F420-dependent LLM class oxidoreductase [Armatimonadota bacterium]MDR7466693.1 TIGR03617 family F420-dependent LLM class oxidoreductase [Armatimonadota bacterium]MDR7492833.1 TIGR03617 family F420-dependent LLM class oxidoreductase [Armatimonadota bacterium]MDR7498609.1 TIGR03617 family F420-dependent LLM class oxidoreductase [Armatimonadota bacterium]
MLVDAHLEYRTLRDVPELARRAEGIGVDGLWFSETAHEPFLGAALAAEHTTKVSVGTSVAIAFVRSPTLLAHLAWDLAALAEGRFILGLGTQVRGHIVRRYGMPWDAPAPRLRDTVRAIRAVWRTWRTGAPLDYRGRGYHLSLMTPFFTPPRHDYAVPIATAGVNPVMCRVAGEVADGFQVHPLHTAAYLREVILPAIRRGQARAGRGAVPLPISAAVFVVTDGLRGPGADAARRAIAFYASTPSYRGVLAHHGWEEVGARLSRLAGQGAWTAMAGEVTDEMLTTIAVVAPPEDAGAALRARYEGLVDRIGPYRPYSPADDPWWERLLQGIRAQAP